MGISLNMILNITNYTINKYYKIRNSPMKYLTLFFFLILSYSPLFGQSYATTSKFRSFSICDMDFENNRKFNCQKEPGKVLFRKIDIIPNKSITLYFKDENQNESISKLWESRNFEMNKTNDLFIYKYLEADLNKVGAFSINVIMRLDYSVQSLICFMNENGQLIEIKLFDKEI